MKRHPIQDQPVFYSALKYVLLQPWLKLTLRPKVHGVENVPAEGGVLLAGNHLSYLDWLMVPMSLPRMVRYVAKAEYFEGTGLRGAWNRFFFTNTGNVPIDRSGATAAEGAMLAAKTILNGGHIFGIYPEGTRSHDGRLYRGKTGVARLALETRMPLIPVAVIGTDVLAPPGKTFGRWTRPTVIFGRPIDLAPYAGRERDRAAQRELTDRVMAEIQKLSRQEYVSDTYAADARRASSRG
ncbi:1-acyl-sn-glycerol-3-phosphate acyltransferase [Nocardioides albertanoniae]|uniref:1-acyl-sn-glycerol-3-phosphate acyltransferase n=1 Tax=Nocardioides albertanoniae TaxID=1175486 RepID=A0A543A635_9ACTN|nr:lysophospholipid acyltransferase family protein [Nocardioides albertanoniae]TQL68030.1 1-acyl-sn-glycerol-3-phosphate acyltransferase [Nocardioides albertanoniae]